MMYRKTKAWSGLSVTVRSSLVTLLMAHLIKYRVLVLQLCISSGINTQVQLGMYFFYWTGFNKVAVLPQTTNNEYTFLTTTK